MIRSMTGYGRAIATKNGREYTVEIRSVNNRYLDCSVRLPRMFSFCEDAVKQQIKEQVTRGKIDVFVSVNAAGACEEKISLNRPVLEEYLQALRTISAEYGVRDDLSVSTLSKLPDVFTVEKESADEDQIAEDLKSTVSQALSSYNAMRETEGAAMERDLRSRAETILSCVAKVEARSPITVSEYRARLTAKMKEVLESTSVDENRILSEAAIFADKIAVDEETVRLRSHFAQMDQMLTGGGQIGRKLDFLLQEMNRETNTIGSKGNDLEQARTVVEIKAELEKIREQVQNIE